MGDQQELSALLRGLWQHISRRRRIQLTGLFGLMLVGTAAELLSLGMVLPFLGALTSPERIFSHPWAQPLIRVLNLTSPQQLLLPLTLLFGAAAVFSGVARVALLWWQTHLGNRVGTDIGSEAYRRTLYQPYAVHTSRNSSEVVAALMTKVQTIVYFVIIPLLQLISSMLVVAIIVAFMVLVDPKLTGMSFAAFGGLYVIVAYASKRGLKRDSERVTAGQREVAQVVQEGLGGIRDVLIDGLQQTYFRLYHRADERLRRALSNIAVLGGAPRPVIEAFGLVLIGWLAYLMSKRPEGMVAAIPVLGALALASQRLLPVVQQGYAGWTSMLGGQASLRDVLALLDQPLPVYSKLPPPAPIAFNRQIALRDLHFRYNVQGPWILRGIALQIERGSRIGFIGTTGSGKSTVLDILMGLLEPTSGRLCVDGVDIDEHNQRAWQAHIAHVPQTIYLADATVAENIAFGTPPEEIDLERVRRAAQRAQIAESIESWSAGYDTFVGERGIRLSGGQRQRIGIARALYKQSDVIVFDEATSALDNETERAVVEAIDALGPELTVIIVAHRLTTLRSCDQIVELRGGVVHRVGTYQVMIEQAV